MNELDATHPVPIIYQVIPILLRGGVLLLTLFFIGLVWQWLRGNSLLGTEWIDTLVRGQGFAGGIIFIVVGSGLTAIGIPRQIFSFLGGYAFGFIVGTGLALLATLIGALAAFQYARYMGRAFLIKHFPRSIKKMDDFLTDRAMMMILILRLAPFTNNLATNLAGGISGMRLIPFSIGSVLGYLPQTLIFALLGSGVNIDQELRTVLSVTLFIISSILGIWLWQRLPT